MKKLQFIFAAAALLVLSLGMMGCDPNNPNNPDMPAIVSTSETNNGDGIVVEVIYKNNIRLYFELTSPTECALTLYKDYYGWYNEGFEQYAYSGDLVIPETITHKGVTYTVTDISYGVSLSKNVPSVWIPKTVVADNIMSLVHDWFELTAINVSVDNPKYASEDGVFFDKAKTALLRYPNNKIGESYTVPNGVTKIDYRAFAGSKSLISVLLPSTITNMDFSVFKDCSSLSTLTCLATTPPQLYFIEGNSSFYESSITTAKVPAGSVSAYRGAAGWKDLTIVAL